MKYILKSKTGAEAEIDEQLVRDMVINDWQHDMAAAAEYGDEAIAQMVNEGNLDDYFDGDVYESNDFTIIRTAV